VRILADSLNAEFILQGRVTGRRIVGSVSWSAFIAPGGANTKSYHCWTGRNRNNPEVPFVAARISPPLGQVPRSAGRG
jgi:hypothetical protein